MRQQFVYQYWIKDLTAQYKNTWIGGLVEASSENSAKLILMRKHNLKLASDVRLDVTSYKTISEACNDNQGN